MIIRKLSACTVFSISLISTLSFARFTAILPCMIFLTIVTAGCGIALLVSGIHRMENKENSVSPDGHPGHKKTNPVPSAILPLHKQANSGSADGHPRQKQAGFYLLIISLGISFGLSASERIDFYKLSAFTGIDLSRVTSFTGVCAQDSTVGKENRIIHYIDLMTVHSHILDASAGAKGRVMVITEKGTCLYTGEIVTITNILTSSHFRPDIDYQCWVKGDHILRSGFSLPLFWVRKEIHLSLMGRIRHMGYPASALFEALFLGKRENLPDQLYAGFEKTGTLHILALSGLHVGILYGCMTLLLFFLPGKWIKYPAGFIIILCYLFLVGPRPSLLRASVMLIVFGIAYLLSLERDPINLLAIAAIIILMIDPFSAFSLSFHLSFLAIIGIIVIGRSVASIIKPFLPLSISHPLAYSIGAQAATSPIILRTFGIVYPSGIIVTLLLLPLITVFFIGGIIFLLLSAVPFPFIREGGELFFSYLYTIILTITAVFSHIPGISCEWKGWYWVIFFILTTPFLFNMGIISRKIYKKVCKSL